MKKLLIILACGMISLTAAAQESNSSNTKKSTSKWYVQAEAGVDNTGSDNMNIGTMGGNIGFTGGIELGYMFNSYFGIGAQLRYANPHAMDDHGNKYGLNSVEPSINFTLNLSNLIFKYDENRKNFINLYAGVAGAFTSALPTDVKFENIDYNDNNYAFGFRTGLQYERSLKKDWALLVNAGINCFNDKYEKRKGGGMDSHLDLQIGIRKYLAVGGAKRREDWKEVIVNVDTVYTKTTIIDTTYIHAPKDMYSIFFERDHIDILPTEVGKIKDMAKFLTDHPEKIVFVFGYADKNTGTEKRNAWLAKNRARVICEQLTNTYGIDPSRLISYDQGDKVQPFAQEEFEKNRATICVITDFQRK